MNVFIFRRDFRLEDNTSLIECHKFEEKILPIFIFTPEQFSDQNSYRSEKSVQFMIESLESLQKQLSKIGTKLRTYYGDNLSVLREINKQKKIKTIFFNSDYTPYALKRDTQIASEFECESFEDYTLCGMKNVVTKSGTYYKMFSPYYRNVISQIGNVSTQNIKKFNFISSKEDFENNFSFFPENTNYDTPSERAPSERAPSERAPSEGGRENAMKILNHITDFKNYAKERDFVAIPTTHLSAHIKFGTVSIREVCKIFQKKLKSNSETLIKQLIWHDFYAYIMYHTDKKQTLGNSNMKELSIQWDTSKSKFEKWKKGETGFPYVDAGMRQLNETGYLPNRARLVVASFLIMLLHINWKKGEKYFAKKLYDYDPSSNNGNWQWVAQVGVDNPRVWPRIFNPIQQSKLTDPNCEYIKTWVPELKEVENKKIHNLKLEGVYISPIVDYEKERKEAQKRYHQAKEKGKVK